MLGHPARFGAGQAHMKVCILSEKRLNRIFISPAWVASKHTPFQRSSLTSWHLRFWGDHFSASVARPVEIAGQVVVPAGAEARGRIVEAVPQGRFNVPLPLRKEAQSMRMAVNACAVTKAVLLR